MARMITGWDIGGAHLKVARIDRSGRLLYTEQFATPLWQGPDHLHTVLTGVRELLDGGSRHVVTMTAELADCFSDRNSGVGSIMERFVHVFPADDTLFYAGEAGFAGFDAAQDLTGRIASANWLATADYLAGLFGNGMLVDIGSTTTDIIPFHGGRPAPAGLTDHQRLQSGELVYTGVVRTPVMAVTGKVPFRDRWQRLAAENFATMADVYRLTGQLQEHQDVMAAADGGEKTVPGSVNRLARMIGLDADPSIPMSAWTQLAEYIAMQQQQMILDAISQVVAQHEGKTFPLLIGAGCGRFLLPALAEQRGVSAEDFSAHLNTEPSLFVKAGDNASAVSLALLALREQV